MVSEVNRLKILYKAATGEKQKRKYASIIKNIIVPTIDKILFCVEENNGRNAKDELEQIIVEVNNEYKSGNRKI